MQPEPKAPVRKISNKGFRVIICKFPSLKNNSSITCEGRLELDFAFLLEYDSDVIWFRPQPRTIEYIMGRKKHIYTPDFAVKRHSRPGTQLVEVKPEDKIKANLEKFEIIKSTSASMGYDFYMVSEHFIRAQPRLSNIKYLYRFARTEITREDYNLTVDFFKEQKGRSTLSEAERYFKTHGISRNVLLALMYRKVIHIDVNKGFKPDSLLELNLNI